MALIDRVRERVETDLDDTELEFLIAEAQTEIRSRYGPDRDTGNPITVTVRGLRRSLDMARPVDVDETVTVVEHAAMFTANTTELAANDYRVLNGGRTLERAGTGDNPRSTWAPIVDVTYVPVDDQPQRDEVTIKLVAFTVQYRGLSSEQIGDVRQTERDYTTERGALLASLAPRKGLLLA